MAVYLVTYDLNSPGQNYERLYEAIKQYQYCKGLESVWFISSNSSASAIRDYLRQHIDGNDKLFVSSLGGWASWNVNCADWIKQR